MAETKIICDTDVLIDYFDARQTRHSITKKTLEESIRLDNVMLSVISKMELMTGAATKTELTSITKKLKRFDIILIDPTITGLSLTLLQTYRLSHGLAIPDCFIAATALATELQIFTYNVKDFKFIEGIKLYKP